MKRKHSLLLIIALLPVLAGSPGYGYESVLIKADENTEVLNTKSVTTPTAQTDIVNFLAANNIRTVEDYVQWLSANMRYEEKVDPTDWSVWQKTLNRRYGDCKNLSALNAEVL